MTFVHILGEGVNAWIKNSLSVAIKNNILIKLFVQSSIFLILTKYSILPQQFNHIYRISVSLVISNTYINTTINGSKNSALVIVTQISKSRLQYKLQCGGRGGND